MRLAGAIIQMSNVRLSIRTAHFLGRGLYKYYARGRERALENLRASYPEKSNDWIERVARSSFEQLARLPFEVFLNPRLLRRSTYLNYFDVDGEGFAPMFKHIKSGRGLIMVTGHYGAFETLGYAMAARGMQPYSVGRPIDNPYIDRYLRRVREREGQRIIDKKGAVDQMEQVLSSGNILGLVADQNGRRKDIFVDFFGRKAATYKSIGLLAMQHNVPIVVGFCRRLGGQYRFKVGTNRFIEPHEWQQQENPLQWITAEYTRAIEEFVREEPEQYWWLHRRWRTRPPAERRAEKAARDDPNNSGVSG
jgi:KDO2-lipid IV(A) lauroyltransferase